MKAIERLIATNVKLAEVKSASKWAEKWRSRKKPTIVPVPVKTGKPNIPVHNVKPSNTSVSIMIDLTQEGTPTEVREHMKYMLDRVYNLAIKEGWDWYEDKSAGEKEKDVEESAKKKDVVRGKEKTSHSGVEKPAARAVKRSNLRRR